MMRWKKDSPMEPALRQGAHIYIPFMVCFEKRGVPSGDMGYLASIKCRDCWIELRRWALKKKWAEESVRLAWNTRAPILSAEEMEMLEGME